MAYINLKVLKTKHLFWFILSILALSTFGIVIYNKTCIARKGTPNWVVFPGQEWKTVNPEAAGLDVDKFEAWINRHNPVFGKGAGGQKPDTGGVVLVRGGYILRTWGDPNFKYQSASLGKTFTRMALQLAVDEGLVKSSDDVVRLYWTGEGLLGSHKVLNYGYHRNLTFRHLSEMTGGFPVTNGDFWKSKKNVPLWAKYTSDPDYDNYSHVRPGKKYCYSSGGYWRLSQALTAIWNQDLKQVLDKRIMSKIGIPESRWQWVSGEEVRNKIDFYPEIPGYGKYLDPPYRINGIPVLGGGGWVIMSALDFARVGLLIANSGVWNGERLISKIAGNSGVQANTVNGWGCVNGKNGYFSYGKVATGFKDPTRDELASWIIGPVKIEVDN